MVNWLDRANPQAGGAEIHLHEVFSRLASRGHDVHLLCSRYPGSTGRETIDGLQVHRTGGRLSFLLRARPYYTRTLRALDFDVIVEDLNKVPLFTPWWGRVPVVAIVHHLFGTTAFREASPPLALATWLLERPIPSVFRGVPIVAVSDSTRADLVERGVDPARITVVPNGVDLDLYRPDAQMGRFDWPAVVYLGRLKRYKGVDLLVRAAASLRDRIPQLRVVVAGRGDDLARLRSLADRLGVGDTIEFAGFVSVERKLELFRRSWVHVLTSSKEGWGIAVIEAGACGTTSVASDVPGLRDSVRHDSTGVLVPHGDVDALAAALERLLTDRDQVERLGRAALEYAQSFTWDEAADRIERILSDRVAAAGAGR